MSDLRKLPLEDEELKGVEGEVIEIDPIDIEGEVMPPPESSWRDALRIDGAPSKDEAVDLAAEAFGVPEVADTLRGFGEGTTIGFGDELAGLGEAALGGDYAETRDAIRDEQNQAAADNPGAFAGGAVGGALATAPILASPILGAGTRAGRLAAASGEGVLLGAAGGAGGSEGDLGSDRFAGDVMRGAALGGVMGAAGGVVSEGARGLGAVMRRHAARSGADAAADEGGSLLGQLVERAQPARAPAEVAADALRSLDDIADEMGEGVADAGDAVRRAQRAARRARDGGASVAPWLDEIGAAVDEVRPTMNSRLAGIGGSGRSGLAERQAMRRARVGSPANFSRLEGIRRRIADALLDKPSPELQRLHDDLAESLASAAGGLGDSRGAAYMDGVLAAERAAMAQARTGRTRGQMMRDALAGAGGTYVGGIGLDLAQGREPDLVPGVGDALGGVAGGLARSPRVQQGLSRMGAGVAGGIERAADVIPRIAAGPAASAIAEDGDDEPPLLTLDELEAVEAEEEPPLLTLEELEAVEQEQ